MKFKNLTPILAVIILAATSCKKEGSQNSSSPLNGNWKFISATGSTSIINAVTSGSDELKTESISTFTSSNPKGSYNFTATNFDAVGVGYDYVGNDIFRIYENRVLQNEIISPRNGTLPPTNVTTKYKLIGTDSMYFESSAGGGTTNQSGCKFKLEDTKLTLFIGSNTKTITSLGGNTISADTILIKTTVILQKQ